MDCGVLKSPNNGFVSFKSTRYDSTATYSCNKGFILVGVSTRKCLLSGRWSDAPPTCKMEEVSCPTLSEIQDGFVDISGNTVGSVAAYSCNQGFELIGKRKRTCQENGLWSSTEPSCRKSKPLLTITKVYTMSTLLLCYYKMPQCIILVSKNNTYL